MAHVTWVNGCQGHGLCLASVWQALCRQVVHHVECLACWVFDKPLVAKWFIVSGIKEPTNPDFKVSTNPTLKEPTNPKFKVSTNPTFKEPTNPTFKVSKNPPFKVPTNLLRNHQGTTTSLLFPGEPTLRLHLPSENGSRYRVQKHEGI